MSETEKSIGMLWSLTGITTLYLTLNIAFETFGSEFFLPSIRLDGVDKYAATVYGFYITTPLILVMHYLTRTYAKEYGKEQWYFRFPVSFNRTLDGLPSFQKQYQLFFFYIFLVVPSLIHIHFFNKFLHGSVFIKGNTEAILVGWEHFFINLSLFEHKLRHIRYGDIGHGIDYIPIFLPYSILVLCVLHVLSIAYTYKTIRRLNNQGV